jgi:acetoin utilization protein AcuC
MHEAGAMVAGGSLRAMEAILRGDVEHAFHPGGGLHHAMPDRASGFCIYDDPALAIARARRDGLRVLYVDLDVHHGDGVQAIHWDDAGVVTLSFHESGRYLFPGTGGVGELGEGSAAGTAINVPLEPGTGEGPWLEAVRTLLPEVAAAFGPDIVVSQHGADSHAWDPLAHLRVTTTAMGEAARIVDAVAHRWASGRWLSTGGGGYDAYRVVPRSWSLVWLAGAHRDVPAATPAAWRDTWADEAARYGQAPMPEAFTDQPNAGEPVDWGQEEAESRSRSTVALVRRLVVPRLIREGRDRGWWDPLAAAAATPPPTRSGEHRAADGADPRIIEAVDSATWDGLTPAQGVIAPFDPIAAHGLVAAGLRDGLAVTAAVVGTTVVGVAASRIGETGTSELLAVGVAKGWRRRGVATKMLAAHVASAPARFTAEVTVAERDPLDPLDRAVRAAIARTLLQHAGFEIVTSAREIHSTDPSAVTAVRAAAR